MTAQSALPHTGQLQSRRVRIVFVALAAGLAIVPMATAKFGISLSLSQAQPRVNVPVRAELRADDSVRGRCAMSLIAVDPRSNVTKALDAFVNGSVTIIGTSSVTIRNIRSYPRIGFVVLMKRSGPRTWRAQIRFPRSGRWHLIVPNWCAPGYAAPLPIDRIVRVRR